MAASVNFSGGTLSLYDRHHGTSVEGGDGPDALGAYQRLLDAAIDSGAAVSCDGRVMVIVLESPDDQYLPIHVRIGRTATITDPDMQVSDPFPDDPPDRPSRLGLRRRLAHGSAL